ncbi:hypothetical protein [Streptomyces fragilis]|uniref:Lipoprotein n=1 Tax=Streptomyces fragilis TaxID=67301 RepID=A0ABV2YP12_9ACTN|nr:hypothetical protein [Streptomyces fragilis]
MKLRTRRPLAALAAATALVAGATACEEQDAAKGAEQAATEEKGGGDPVSALTAAFRKTSEVKTAHLEMTMTVPGAQGGEITMTGVQGWDPALLDVTMSGAALGGGQAGAPEEIRAVMVDNVMYMDMGEAASAEMDGKRWMKIDYAEIGKAAEKEGGAGAGGLSGAMNENMNQDPTESLAILLESPNIRSLGPEKVNGLQAEHYKGTVPVKEMIDSNKAFAELDEEQRDKLAATVEQAGVESYEIEVWVTEDDLPTRMNVVMDSSLGEMKIKMDMSDFGAEVKVAAPPAAETFDLAEMMSGAGA